MDFYRKMRIVCLAIPKGNIASYGQIALLCGCPNHSRQVGYGLKHCLAGNDVPAHRVVNSRGELSGAIHFEMPDLQKLLLEAEGIETFWNGRHWQADMKKYGWENSPAEAEALRKCFGEE